MEIYEPVTLKKLGLGEKFPRKSLHSRRTALVVGLMKPNTKLAISALKLYLGHKRLDTKDGRIIKMNEQRQHLQSGHHSHPIETPIEQKILNRTWSDEIGIILQSRNINIINNDHKECKITQNKTIMDYAVEYARCHELNMSVLVPINHARMLKRMYLPC